MPFHELLHRQCRTALQVYGEAKARVQKTGAVKVLFGAERFSLEIPKRVWQRGDDVGGPPKEAERVVVAKNLNAICSSRAVDGKCAVVVNATVVKGPGQGDCIGM